MAERPTTITYVDTETGRVHRFDAEVEQGATRAQIARRLEKIHGMQTGRIRITRGV